MSIDFLIEAVNRKPKKVNARKERSSKYEPILTAFLESGHELVRVDTDVEANYMSMNLKKLLKKKGIENVKVSVRNGTVFLEK